MIILHEINQLEMGGAERVVHGIAKFDKENTHVVYTYKDGPMRKEFEAIGVQIIIEDEKATDNVNADIIHIHTGGEPSHIASLVQGDQPIIETVHCPVVSAVRDAFVTARVGVTNQVAMKNRYCRTIYNGIDAERLEATSKKDKTLREEYGIPENAFVIGRLGRLGYDKNVEEFLIACWKFKKTHKDRPVYVLIAGGEAKNARGYAAKIRVAAASLPMENVIFIGETQDVGWCYEAMDVFLYPSLTEAFGLVWMEAMAAGVAVVTYSTDVSKELLTGAAYLTPYNTIDNLVYGLDLMYRRPELMEEFQRLGHELAMAHFTAEKMSENYQALYKEVLVKWQVQNLALEEALVGHVG